MDWQDKKEVKKGDIGERIINDWLEENNLIVYEPVTGGAHGFDRLVSKGKKQLVIVEIKTKAKRNYFPDTGIDYKHYSKYKEISKKHNLTVLIFFIDEMLGQIYFGRLSELDMPNEYYYNGKYYSYPKVETKKQKIIYFYQPNMKVIKSLKKEEIDAIKKHQSRNYDYIQ